MKDRIILAPGVVYEEGPHEYYHTGKQLSGVTGLISKRLGLKMSDAFVGEARDEGLHIHQTIEKWLDGGEFESIHPGALWIKSYLEKRYIDPPLFCQAETLVSDRQRYSSSVDILAKTAIGELAIYDIKRTFKRQYVTWQLSIYKYLIEHNTKWRVTYGACLGFRDQAAYPILFYQDSDVEELLYNSWS